MPLCNTVLTISPPDGIFRRAVGKVEVSSPVGLQHVDTHWVFYAPQEDLVIDLVPGLFILIMDETYQQPGRRVSVLRNMVPDLCIPYLDTEIALYGSRDDIRQRAGIAYTDLLHI